MVGFADEGERCKAADERRRGLLLGHGGLGWQSVGFGYRCGDVGGIRAGPGSVGHDPGVELEVVRWGAGIVVLAFEFFWAKGDDGAAAFDAECERKLGRLVETGAEVASANIIIL